MKQFITRDGEVDVVLRGPADPADVPLAAHANVLHLVGQVIAAVKVERLHGVHRVAEEVLRAALWRQVVEVARVLGHLPVKGVE